MVKSALAGMFGRSPFTPMKKHMEIVASCAAEILPLIQAVEEGDQQKVESAREKIFQLEQEADDKKNAIRSNLPKSLLMPVDRRDLLEILHAQDSIADMAQDVAGLFTIKPLEIPSAFGSLLQDYAQRVVDAVRQCDEIVNELDELLEIGFRGKHAERVEEKIEVLGAIETETDDLGTELSTLLFKIDDQMSTGTFFLWHELIRRIGDIADFAEDVGDRLRLLMAR